MHQIPKALISRRSFRQLPSISRRFKATASIVPKSSNPQLAFPCLDRLEQKTKKLASAVNDHQVFCKPTMSSLEGGPEPSYSRVVTGFDIYEHTKPTFMDNGGFLPSYQIAYESWGTLNSKKDNMILLHTGLSASSHAKSRPENPKSGWWENFIGSGKYLDTDKYFVVCTNVLGGCYGSTGPSSRDPATNEYYGTRFPILTINDMVRAQRELVRSVFGVTKLHASIGASMGGMQSLAYGWEFPDEVEHIVSISGCARSHPYSIALRHTQRQVLMSDPNWNRGFYYDGIPPHIGMKLAREIATVTYRSGPEWESRFGRNRADESKPVAFCPDFLVETYLDHAGEKFCLEYDANSLLYVLKAMDVFDLGKRNREKANQSRYASEREFCAEASDNSPSALPEVPYQEKIRKATDTLEESWKDLQEGMSKIADKKVLVVGVESDILFPVWQQREIADVLKSVSQKKDNIQYLELGTDISNYGHDTFLLNLDHFGPKVRNFLEQP